MNVKFVQGLKAKVKRDNLLDLKLGIWCLERSFWMAFPNRYAIEVHVLRKASTKMPPPKIVFTIQNE